MMRFLALFLITNSAVAATAAAATSGVLAIAAPLAAVAVAGLVLTIRVVVTAPSPNRSVSRGELQRLLDTTETKER